MKIIISPAKKMVSDVDTIEPSGLPIYLEETEKIYDKLRSLSYTELKKLWKCNDSIAEQNYERLQNMNLREMLTPAVLAYDGIAYQYMAAGVFENKNFDYIEKHLYILSGFYGVLRAMDGVTPYRLEMQAKCEVDGAKDLYHFWGDKLYKAVMDDSRTIINLASREYSKCIEKYLGNSDKYIAITFCEQYGGKLLTKGTYAKMARGEMVRYMAENNIENPAEIKNFDRMGYFLREDLSSENEYVFERNTSVKQ